MSHPAPSERNGRETRMLLATIGVSVGVLLLLAQFRFPEEAARQTAEPAAAPLERLAARATYDELAGIMADLERRLADRLVILEVAPDRNGSRYVIAPRITADRAVALLDGRETVTGREGQPVTIAGRDTLRGLAILTVDAIEDGGVAMPAAPPRTGPRYVAVAEATASGPVLRPVYVGRTDLFEDPAAGRMLSIAAQQQSIPRGAALFSLTGTFIGLAAGSGEATHVVPAAVLQTAAQSAKPPEIQGDLGVDVQPLTPALGRIAGAGTGVVVSYVEPAGPSAATLEPGDVLTAIDGSAVTTVADFRRLMEGRPVGAAAALAIVRARQPQTVTITIGPAMPDAGVASPGLGAALRSVRNVGVEIVTVRRGSAAALAGLQPGDIVVQAGGRKAPSAEALERAYTGAEAGAGVMLTVQRGLQHRIVALEKR